MYSYHMWRAQMIMAEAMWNHIWISVAINGLTCSSSWVVSLI